MTAPARCYLRLSFISRQQKRTLRGNRSMLQRRKLVLVFFTRKLYFSFVIATATAACYLSAIIFQMLNAGALYFRSSSSSSSSSSISITRTLFAYFCGLFLSFHCWISIIIRAKWPGVVCRVWVCLCASLMNSIKFFKPLLFTYTCLALVKVS